MSNECLTSILLVVAGYMPLESFKDLERARFNLDNACLNQGLSAQLEARHHLEATVAEMVADLPTYYRKELKTKLAEILDV